MYLMLLADTLVLLLTETNSLSAKSAFGQLVQFCTSFIETDRYFYQLNISMVRVRQCIPDNSLSIYFRG
jgi:hypothetical protein